MGAARKTGHWALIFVAGIGLTACQDVNMPGFMGKKPGDTTTATQPAGGSVIERDVEAPEIFAAEDQGLWDGRPSLGGVWVAHTDVTEPERVMIRNKQNGQSVVGALFKREVASAGPEFQVSSDAADALGMLAGAPADLSVVALRREEIVIEPPQAEATEADTIAEAEEITAAPLDPITEAEMALDTISAGGTTASAGASNVAPTVDPKPAPQTSSLQKPYIQIGIFSVEANANRTAQMLGSQGISAEVKAGESGGKAFWRVVVGPASTTAARKSLLDKVKAAGFSDAYPVTH